MGNVWLAERTMAASNARLRSSFCISQWPRGAAERFKREGSILGRLAHPHIAELTDAGVTANGEPYLVLEHVEGKPIDEYCDGRRLDVDSASPTVSRCAQCGGARSRESGRSPRRQAFQRAGENEGEVKLLDFGIAKLLADD